MKPVESDRAEAWKIQAHARQRLGLGPRKQNAGMSREPPQQAAQIREPAFAEIGEQRCKLIGRQGRSLGEAWVVAILARQHCEGDALLASHRAESLDTVAPP